MIDVRRRLVEPASTIDVAVYLSFFPHLVAGPIVRAREFLPQLATPRDPNHVAVGSGLALVGLGLIKKVVIADFLARSVVDPVFAVPQAYDAPDVALAAYSYTAQIYCDFSGYTDIAIGLALLMGYVFPQNFLSPYRATGFRDFWRRWHMTLSRFLRDFLYIPLGGSRHGRLLTYRNLMITMVLGGLWHGAAWTFVLWGAFHGAGLVTEHALGGRLRTAAWLRWLVTFHLIVLGWILFRSESVALAGTFLEQLTVPGPATLWTLPVIVAVVVVIGLQLLPTRSDSRDCRCVWRASSPWSSAPDSPCSSRSSVRRYRVRGLLLSSTSGSDVSQPPDDSLMNRFDRHGLRRFRARDGVLAVALAAVLLVLFEGAAIRRAGEAMNPGVGRDAVLVIGRPAGWIADRLPLADAAHRATSWLSPDPELDDRRRLCGIAKQSLRSAFRR